MHFCIIVHFDFDSCQFISIKIYNKVIRQTTQISKWMWKCGVVGRTLSLFNIPIHTLTRTHTQTGPSWNKLPLPRLPLSCALTRRSAAVNQSFGFSWPSRCRTERASERVRGRERKSPQRKIHPFIWDHPFASRPYNWITDLALYIFQCKPAGWVDTISLWVALLTIQRFPCLNITNAADLDHIKS